MSKTNLPKFQGKPVDENMTADFLRGDFGKAVLEEYKERAKSYDHTTFWKSWVRRFAHYALECDSDGEILSYKDGVVKGSDPYAVVLINQIIRPEGLRTATLADLEKIRKPETLDLRDIYIESTLVLKGEEERLLRGKGGYLAKSLAEQIKARQELNPPLMIPLAGLDLVYDPKAKFDLGFKLLEDAEIIHTPILAKERWMLTKFSSEDIDERTGLPKKTVLVSEKAGKERNRWLAPYSTDTGLFNFEPIGTSTYDKKFDFLYYYFPISGESNPVGRIVVVRDEGT